MNYNKRLDLVEESGIRRYKGYAKKEGMIDFTIGDTCFNVSDSIKYGVMKDLIENHTHYELTQGNETVRSLISKKENALQYTKEEVLLTIGATEGIYVALVAILNEGDEVILFKPYYSLYKNAVIQNGGKIVEIDGLRGIKIDDLEREITKHTKVIVLNIPNNPTGELYTDEIEELIEIVQKHDIYIIIDATYEELIYDGKKIEYSRWMKVKERLIIVKSLSKAHAMTGMRLGYVLADKSIMKYLIKVHQMCVSCIPSIFTRAYIEALNEDVKKQLAEYENKRNFLISKLDEMHLEYIKPEGAFYICLYVPSGMSSIEYTQELMSEAQVVCVPGIYFGDDRIIRLSFSTEWINLINGMKRIQSYIDNKSR